MNVHYSAPWHKRSFDAFLYERLPHLLAEHLPLVDYRVEVTEQDSCGITLTVSAVGEEIEVVYADLPYPSEEGIFQVGEELLVVVPRAAHDELATAEIACVGEQLYEYVRERLGKAPDNLVWDVELVRAWLPLAQWMGEFFDYRGKASWATYVQRLDQTNWLARYSHVRRIAIQHHQYLFTAGHFGRACPFETPEGPNIGRIIQVALGAEVRDGRLVIVDDSPEAALGLGASMIPLLEHNEPSRLLMGANMLRQWMMPPTPEEALVQSGNEPDAEEFWCGRNLLTAFVSWGSGTYEDGIIISESCARRLSFDGPIEAGDKLSNRHGAKGVVSRVVPDQQMPHLVDGTAVELVYNFVSIHARQHFGQVREALLSRIARVQGRPIIAPAFHAPGERQIHAWLDQVGLEHDGMQALAVESNGKREVRRATVGEVYWGRPFHLASEKLHVSTMRERGQFVNEYDYYALRDVGAFELMREFFAANESPSFQFRRIMHNVAAVGIAVRLEERGLSFHLQEPEGEVLTLAQPIAHPWLRNAMLTHIGVREDIAGYHALVSANSRMQRMMTSGAPESLKQQVSMQLAQRVQEFCAVLLEPLQFRARVSYSGRAVAIPDGDLHIDKVGLSEDIAWEFFGRQVAEKVGEEAVRNRSEEAVRALDETMAQAWVVIHRAPTLAPQTFLAFHPVRTADHVIHLHPLVSGLLQMDFDGDQVSVFLPMSEQAQREASELLSVAGHLRRVPELLKEIVPFADVLWGLAYEHLTQGRLDVLLPVVTGVNQNEMGGVETGGIVTSERLGEALQEAMRHEGIESVLAMLDGLMQRGFEAVRAAGASISPFVGSRFTLPTVPEEDEGLSWEIYRREVDEWLAADSNYLEEDMGVQLLAIKSGARGEIRQLTGLISTQGVVKNVEGEMVPIGHGYREGLAARELFALAVGARERMAHILQDWEQVKQEIHGRSITKSFSVLARAMRAEQPGMVFAHAASIGEIDPLTDHDSRLFVGLPLA